MSTRRRPDAAALLGRALLRDAGIAGCAVELVAATAHPWASATFIGERVELELRCDDGAGGWIESLAEAELSLPGWLVAELTTQVTANGADVSALVLREG